MTEIT